MPSVDNKSLQLSDLAKRIKNARVAARLSQADLASGIGVSDKSISAYEQGRSTPPFEKLKKIANVSNHPLAYFTEDDNQEASISSKLASIERELTEVKELLKKVKK
jgi:transcriptional regulator with XRE-family HTH domain